MSRARTAFAEQKIAQAERDAIAEVRGSAVEIAVEAARKVLGDKVDAQAAGKLFQQSIDAVKSKLN
jgi:F-type H+-transporting ATPase subunit b